MARKWTPAQREHDRSQKRLARRNEREVREAEEQRRKNVREKSKRQREQKKQEQQQQALEQQHGYATPYSSFQRPPRVQTAPPRAPFGAMTPATTEKMNQKRQLRENANKTIEGLAKAAMDKVIANTDAATKDVDGDWQKEHDWQQEMLTTQPVSLNGMYSRQSFASSHVPQFHDPAAGFAPTNVSSSQQAQADPNGVAALLPMESPRRSHHSQPQSNDQFRSWMDGFVPSQGGPSLRAFHHAPGPGRAFHDDSPSQQAQADPNGVVALPPMESPRRSHHSQPQSNDQFRSWMDGFVPSQGGPSLRASHHAPGPGRAFHDDSPSQQAQADPNGVVALPPMESPRRSHHSQPQSNDQFRSWMDGFVPSQGGPSLRASHHAPGPGRAFHDDSPSQQAQADPNGVAALPPMESPRRSHHSQPQSNDGFVPSQGGPSLRASHHAPGPGRAFHDDSPSQQAQADPNGVVALPPMESPRRSHHSQPQSNDQFRSWMDGFVPSQGGPSLRASHHAPGPGRAFHDDSPSQQAQADPNGVVALPPMESPRRSHHSQPQSNDQFRSWMDGFVPSQGGPSLRASHHAPGPGRAFHDDSPSQQAQADPNGVVALPPMESPRRSHHSQPQSNDQFRSWMDGFVPSQGGPSLRASHHAPGPGRAFHDDSPSQQAQADPNGVAAIRHTSRQAAFSQKEKEALEETKSAQALEAIEESIRLDNAYEMDQLRQKLKSDSARLGRFVCTRAGIRRVEIWKEGTAFKELRKRRKDLNSKRAALEKQDETRKASEQLQKEKGNDTAKILFVVGRDESVRLHLDSVQQQEAELAEEERALNLEKEAHIRSLKLMKSEDASRFQSRPTLDGRYVPLALLGKGGFSEVWRAFDLTERREVAVKIQQVDTRWSDANKDNYIRHVTRECEIHRNVRHARIVSLYDVFEIDNDSVAIVLEYCKGSDLDTLLKAKKTLLERDARAILIQILSGMQYLSQGIIHYDLKPANILFDEHGDAKITDFGLSKIVADATDPAATSIELTSQGAGTLYYLPPECFQTAPSIRISSKVDIWSIGVIYYQMLYGKKPFGEGQTQETIRREQTMLNAREVHFPERPDVSEAGKGFIQACLTHDQSFRPTMGQLCENPYILEEQQFEEEDDGDDNDEEDDDEDDDDKEDDAVDDDDEEDAVEAGHAPSTMEPASAPSTANPPLRRTCQGTTLKGKPCGRFPQKGSKYCKTHHP